MILIYKNQCTQQCIMEGYCGPSAQLWTHRLVGLIAVDWLAVAVASEGTASRPQRMTMSAQDFGSR